MAETPFLDSLGPIRSASSFATFTLPAHMAAFCGYYPTIDGLPIVDYYSREGVQLWRLSRGKYKDPSTYGLLLDGATIIDGYQRRGYYTLGVGGVRWFLSPFA